MGYYINTSTDPSYSGKIKDLKDNHNAIETTPAFKENLVCVVNNGMFAAVAYIFSEAEFNEFNQGSRQRTWFVVPEAKKLSGFV